MLSVCVCVRARARACVCVCVRVCQLSYSHMIAGAAGVGGFVPLERTVVDVCWHGQCCRHSDYGRRGEVGRGKGGEGEGEGGCMIDLNQEAVSIGS